MCLQVAYTDIDALESVVGILAHGDIVAENVRELTETNFIRIFRLAQLALEYLLHVQDVLSHERRMLLASECASAHCCCVWRCRWWAEQYVCYGYRCTLKYCR